MYDYAIDEELKVRGYKNYTDYLSELIRKDLGEENMKVLVGDYAKRNDARGHDTG